MAYPVRAVAALGVAALCACAAHPASPPQRISVSCASVANARIEQNIAAVAAHRYRSASYDAERAARISLTCGQRWRAANELVLAAELAHQTGDVARARRLVREGFALMRGVRAPVSGSAVTSNLLAEKLHSTRREIEGQWAYW